jgi:hypothetical protein
MDLKKETFKGEMMLKIKDKDDLFKYLHTIQISYQGTVSNAAII